MTTIEEEILIDAPIDGAFEYMAPPDHHVTISPGLVDVRGVEPLPNGGRETDFTFRSLGRNLDAHSRDVEVDPPRRRVYEFAGDVDGRVTYEFERVGDGTRFTYVNESNRPDPRC